MKYFIDDQIYFQGVKQPARKVECHQLEFDKIGNAHFYDNDGDSYCLPKDRIMSDDEK
jgi:hypothetical protein